MVANDAQVFERTAYGMLTVAGKDRVVLGLDGKDGEEAVVLSVHDDGPAGLSARGAGRRSILVGLTPAITAQRVKDSGVRSAGIQRPNDHFRRSPRAET